MKYRTIVVDPPWPFAQAWLKNGKSEAASPRFHYRADRESRGRGAAAKYTLMSVEELASLPIGDWAEDSAHLYLWTTNSFVVQAHACAEAWRFKPKTLLTWVKPRLGMGSYYRNNTEHVVFGVRGSLKVLRHDCRTAFTAEQGRHSEKPAAFYDMVESMSPGPYLDVFARKQRLGWDAWGDEVYCPPWLPEPRSLAAPERSPP